MPKTNSSKSATIKANTGDGRTRSWACVVYPESAPQNWLEIIADLKSPFFVSPLHDKDIDPQNQPKKPHYHVIYAPENKKSGEQIKEIFEKIGGVGLEPVNSIRGYARYLCHLDNPEKAQYDPEQVRSFGGADYTSIIGLPTDKYKAIREMMAYCRDNHIFSYAELLDYCSVCRYDWFRVLCDNGSVVMMYYLKSRMWSADKNNISAKVHCDNDGVIIE